MEIASIVPVQAESFPTTESIEPSRPRVDAEGFGARFEHFLGTFTAEILRPESIFLMAFGSAAFRVARFATLAKLTSSPATGFFTRGAGARASASAVGWLAETNALTLGHSALAKVAGQAWNLEGFAKNWASNALLMGSLRIFGSLATSFDSPRTSELARQIGLFAAIGLSHRVEDKLGWQTPGSNAWEEALLNWIHFNAGAAVAKTALGPSFRRWEIKTDALSRNLGTPSSGALSANPALSLATSSPVKTLLPPRAALNLNLLSIGEAMSSSIPNWRDSMNFGKIPKR